MKRNKKISLVRLKEKLTLAHLHLTIYLWRIFSRKAPKHPAMRDVNYFKKLYSLDRNRGSLDVQLGVAQGEFLGFSYFLKLRKGNFIESHVLLKGSWERHLLETINMFMSNENSIFIDVGANIGATTIPLAKAYPDAKFYAFEPHPEVFADLQDNLSFNQLRNVKPYNIAITDDKFSTLDFYAQKNSDNLGLSSFKLNHDIGEYEKISVQCNSLDSLFSEISDRIAVIKIDTQGSELSVLRSSLAIISKFRPVIIFEYESEYFTSAEEDERARREILDLFRTLGYSLHYIARGKKFFPKITLAGYFHGEILALPGMSAAEYSETVHVEINK